MTSKGKKCVRISKKAAELILHHSGTSYPLVRKGKPGKSPRVTAPLIRKIVITRRGDKFYYCLEAQDT